MRLLVPASLAALVISLVLEGGAAKLDPASSPDAGAAGADSPRRFVDKRVGPFVVAAKESKADAVVKALGPGLKVFPISEPASPSEIYTAECPDDECLCYYSVLDKAFVLLSLGTDGWNESNRVTRQVGVADALCKQHPVAGVSFATGKGIRLGDTIDKVLAVYGRPQEQKALGGGKLRLSWNTTHDEVPELANSYDARLTFEGGILQAFTIHDGD
jgi:hypothetical protein